MHIRPILSALSRHRASELLIALEIALACAVLCNACFLIIQRLDSMRIDSGVDEESRAVVRLDGYADHLSHDLKEQNGKASSLDRVFYHCQTTVVADDVKHKRNTTRHKY